MFAKSSNGSGMRKKSVCKNLRDHQYINIYIIHEFLTQRGKTNLFGNLRPRVEKIGSLILNFGVGLEISGFAQNIFFFFTFGHFYIK